MSRPVAFERLRHFGQLAAGFDVTRPTGEGWYEEPTEAQHVAAQIFWAKLYARHDGEADRIERCHLRRVHRRGGRSAARLASRGATRPERRSVFNAARAAGRRGDDFDDIPAETALALRGWLIGRFGH